MIFGSVCSGIEAASLAWEPLGWRASFLSEIAAFPRAVLAHHYPNTPLRGDLTEIQAGDHAPIDVLVGGTPCQSFSVTGLRGGLADERGNLALEYLRLADRLRPRWLVWENVPGVLSSSGGRDFGAFLGGLVKLGYGFAYRVLDAQFFRLAQRRGRVFVVGHLGDWRRAAAVLFEPASLRGHPPPRLQARQDVAPTISARSRSGGGLGTDFDCDRGLIAESETFIAHALRADGFDASEDGTGRGTPLVSVHAFDARQSAVIQYGNVAGPLDTHGYSQAVIHARSSSVRRIMPVEAERLQGFPDNWTLIPWRGRPAADCPDGPRYKALGNSMAVPVMRWIGARIAMEDSIQ